MTHDLHAYTYVDAPFDLVTRLLADDTVAVLQEATDDAASEAGGLSRRLELEVGGFAVSKQVTIDVGVFEPRELTSSVVALSWRAARFGLLFPKLTAELEVAAITFDPPRTQLTLSGSYEPPLGAVGAGADRLLLHRLADATAHRFVHQIAERLRHLVDELPADERV